MQITDMYKLDKHLSANTPGLGGRGREGGRGAAPPGETRAPREEGGALKSVRAGAGEGARFPSEECERGPGGHVSTKIPHPHISAWVLGREGTPRPRLCRLQWSGGTARMRREGMGGGGGP